MFPNSRCAQTINIAVKVLNRFGSDTASLRLLPSVAYSCEAHVASGSRTFVPGDRVGVEGTAQHTVVGNAAQPWAGLNVTVVIGGAGGWHTMVKQLDSLGAFTMDYEVPSWASATGDYGLFCRHPVYTGKWGPQFVRPAHWHRVSRSGFSSRLHMGSAAAIVHCAGAWLPPHGLPTLVLV